MTTNKETKTMTLKELKSLSAAELEKYTDMFHSDMTEEQLKEVLGAEDFNAKMTFLCSKKNKKHDAKVKAAKARVANMTRAYMSLRPENKHLITRVANA